MTINSARKRGFQKGQITNPSGKKKGTTSKKTKEYIKMSNLAANDYEKAYKMLWEAMEAKEGWAYQIFFNKLTPRKKYESTAQVILPKEFTTLDEYLSLFIRGFSQFEEYTQYELLTAIKSLNAVKLTEQFSKQKDNPFDKLSAEKMLTIQKWLDEA
jgi:hypothetical protein